MSISKQQITEQAILGIILNKPNKIEECYLEKKHFISNLNGRIYQRAMELYKEKKQIEMVELFSDKDLTIHADYILQLVAGYTGSSSFENLLSIQINNYKRVRLLILSKKVESNDLSYEEFLSEIKKDEMIMDSDSDSQLSVQEIFELVTSSDELLKFEIFKKLQSAVRYSEGTMNIIASRTAVGKSALAINFLNDLSTNYKCLYFNMEMTPKQAYQRLVGMNAKVPISEFGRGRTDNRIASEIMAATNKVKYKKFKIYDGSKSIKSIYKIIQRESIKEHCIVFIDYVGYVTNGKKQNDTERVGEVVRELQRMTMDFNITMFVLAQINRSGTDAPKLENLKDSGELEQSGHTVLLLHNPKFDPTEQYPEYDFIVAKNRSGKLGRIKIEFQKPNQRFIEILEE